MTKESYIVITGASSGIGHASALYLMRRGFHVFAGVRKHEDGERLLGESEGRIRPLLMDLLSQESIIAAADRAAETVGNGGITGLVNNAGIAVAGPLEFLPLKEIRHQFEVNLFGQIRVIQAFLPLLRKCRGRIVNVGSISGRMALPFLGPYAASKSALRAISDSLRMELRPWGIEVSVIEPGGVATPIWKKSASAELQAAETFPPAAAELYGAQLAGMRAAVEKAEHRAIDPEAVARVIARALSERKPKTHYLVGPGTRLRAILANILPDRLLGRLILNAVGIR